MDTMREFMDTMLAAFPRAVVEQDNDGQLVVYTNLTILPHPTVAEGDPLDADTAMVVSMDDVVTCDGCNATDYEGSGWGDTPYCGDCHQNDRAREGDWCEVHQRSYYDNCPLAPCIDCNHPSPDCIEHNGACD